MEKYGWYINKISMDLTSSYFATHFWDHNESAIDLNSSVFY